MTGLAFIVGNGFEARFLNVGARAHIDEELHLMLFVLYAIQSSLHTKFWCRLDELHVLWQFVLLLHLTKPVIVLLLIFGVGDFDHVLVEEAHELWTAHRLFDLADILNEKLVT